MSSVHVSQHPLIAHKIAILRDKSTKPNLFRQLVDEIGSLLVYEVTADLAVTHDRKSTLKPVEYYNKLPKEPNVDICIVLDPMVATAGTAVAVVEILKSWGIKRIKFACVLAVEHGINVLREAHPDIEIYAAAMDSSLNEHGYILPGLGDAGDRTFNTGH